MLPLRMSSCGLPPEDVPAGYESSPAGSVNSGVHPFVRVLEPADGCFGSTGFFGVIEPSMLVASVATFGEPMPDV